MTPEGARAKRAEQNAVSAGRREDRRVRRTTPISRYERGIQLRKDQPALGSLLIAIDVAWRKVSRHVDQAAEACNGKPSGGSMASMTVQSSRSGPRHEREFEWLDAVRDGLEDLVREIPD